MKKGLRYTKYIILGLLLLVIIAVLLLQLPAIQTSILNKVNKNLSEQLGNRISINKADIDYLNQVSLAGIYLEDLQGDTLAYIEHLDVKVSLLGLVKNELLVTEASLKGADIQLKKSTISEDFNFQFLIDAFRPDDTAEKSGLLFDLDKLHLEDTRFSLQNESSAMDLMLDQGTIHLDLLDIDNKKIMVDDLVLNKANIDYRYTSDSKKNRDALQFPNMPWQIEVAAIKTENVDLLIKETNSKPGRRSTMAFDNLHFTDLNLDAQDIQLDSTQIKGRLAQLSLREQSGFQLDNLQLDFDVRDDGISVPNINLETPHSKLKSSTFLTFKEFNDLKNIKALKIKSSFDKSNVSLKDLRYVSEVFAKKGFASLSSTENVILDGDMEGDVQKLRFRNLTARIPGVINTRLNGTLSQLLSKEEFGFDMQVDKLQTSAEKLSNVLPKNTLPLALNTFGNVDVKGKFTGDLQSFEVIDFTFDSDAKTEAQFSGRITDVLYPDLLKLDLNIEKLNTHLDDIKGLIVGELPPSIEEAGAISYVGAYTGTLKDFELNGKLSTDIGNAETDVQLKFDNSYTGASYSGAIQLQDFDLGSVLNNDDFGNVSLSIDADGAGLDISKMNSEMKMTVNKLTYKDVLYENFAFNGIVNQKQINGDFNIDNPNAVAAFQGMLDLSGEEPEMNFVLDVDTLSLLPMNLSTQDIALSGLVEIKGRGNSIDDFIGDLEVSDFNLRKDSIDYHTDSLLLTSTLLGNNNKNINFNTDGIEASIKGDFNLSQIPIYLKDIVDAYIPIQWLVEDNSTIDRSLQTKEIFAASLEIKDESLLHVFAPKLQRLEDLSVYFSVNSEKESLFLNGSILSIAYDKFKVKNFDVFSQNKNNTIENEIRFDDLTGIANVTLPINSINAVLQKDKLTLDVEVQNDSLENLLSLGGNLTNMDGIYEFKFDEELQLDSTNWDIAKENSIQFKKDYLFVNSLLISKDDQALILQSDRHESVGNTPLNVLLANFDIHELTNLMALENDFLYGIADGNILIEDIFKDPTFSGDLFAKDIIVNSKELGDINLVADKRSNSSILDIDLSLDGKGNQLEGKGTLDLNTNAIVFNTSFDSLDITLFDPFIEKIVSESKGTIDGDILINGTTKQPIINGKIKTNETSTLVNFSNTRYQIINQEVLIEDSRFAFDNVMLQDSENRTAAVNGAINHTGFKNFFYDLEVNTDAFQLLNTTLEENPLFYGNLILEAKATIEGPLKLPKLVVDANSLAGTEFHLSPFAEADAVKQDDYIIFTNESAFSQDSLQGIVYELTNDLPLDLALNLTVDKETEFQFILDPKSGDKLTCYGDANLQVAIAPDGQINVFGNYTIESGLYNFSYGKLIYKEFNLAKGGTVVFQGDPLTAQLDVEASYITKATPLAIIEEDDVSSLNDSDLSQLQKRSEVEVALEIDGTIKNPDLNFDLSFSDSDIALNPAVDRRVNEIRSNEEELYNQVFGLILFDSFVSTQKFSIAQSTGNIALSSISNLVEDRLNKLASKLIKGIDLIVNVDTYSTIYIDDDNTSVTEFGLGASKSFFNDRLTLKALGNVDVDNRSSTAALSSIAGDFIIEYKLNQKGNITLEAFRKSDFDVLLEENTNKNGVGISLQKALYLRNKTNN